MILKQSSEQRERQFSEPLRCLKMWQRLSGDMFTESSGEVSIGFTYITGTTACT